jgi:hypothetical protein
MLNNLMMIMKWYTTKMVLGSRAVELASVRMGGSMMLVDSGNRTRLLLQTMAIHAMPWLVRMESQELAKKRTTTPNGMVRKWFVVRREIPPQLGDASARRGNHIRSESEKDRNVVKRIRLLVRVEPEQVVGRIIRIWLAERWLAEPNTDGVASALVQTATLLIQGSKNFKTVEELPMGVKMGPPRIVRKRLGTGLEKRLSVGTRKGLGVGIVDVQMGKSTKWEITVIVVRVFNAFRV